MTVTVVSTNEWEVVRLENDLLSVDVLPAKGGDLLSVVWRALDLDVLWTSPWGLRPAGAVPTGGDTVVSLMEHYPGGWQTVFPNGGDPVRHRGVELGMHGEAWLAPWEWKRDGESAIVMRTRLVRSPFLLKKRVELIGGRVVVTESASTGATCRTT